MKNSIIVVYTLCVIAGGLIGYFAIYLPPTEEEKTAVDVKVEAARPVVIRDTVTKTDIQYRYIYKTRCCCEMCREDSTGKHHE